MKLTQIDESTRRDFLKQLTLALASSSLNPASVGTIAQHIAKAAVTRKPLVYGIHASGAYDPRSSTVAENWIKFQRDYADFKRLVGNREIFLSPDGSDGVVFLTKISPTEIPDLIEKSGGLQQGFSIEDFDEDSSWVEFKNDTSISEVDADYSFDTILEPSSLLKQWWSNWEQYGENFLDEKMANFLSKRGININRNFVVDGNEPGVNRAYVRKNAVGQSQPEDWEYKYEKTVDIKAPHDHQVASPMHQSFENKLNSALKTMLYG